jgi:hypothetical protein
VLRDLPDHMLAARREPADADPTDLGEP